MHGLFEKQERTERALCMTIFSCMNKKKPANELFHLFFSTLWRQGLFFPLEFVFTMFDERRRKIFLSHSPLSENVPFRAAPDFLTNGMVDCVTFSRQSLISNLKLESMLYEYQGRSQVDAGPLRSPSPRILFSSIKKRR
ncbi:hypothetical protein TWF694_010304 [Orbilia ellipsospora]|uniref:Uncharacterized protein n=1 Tax=Orbilia ellipsospora TaxID=2528407 RepID=A0AAV9X9G6_9PEZI